MMQLRQMSALSILLLAMFTGACAKDSLPPEPQVIRLPPVEVLRYVYPTVPGDSLMCLQAPIVPETLETDNQATAWGVMTFDAWEDCAAKLSWLRDLVATWPK